MSGPIALSSAARGSMALGAIAVLAAAGAAQLRPQVVLGRDDAEFARALQLANYSDLCNAVLDMMRATGAASGPAVEALKEEIAAADGEPLDEEKDVRYMVAAYGHARIAYFHSLIYPADSFEKTKYLETALERFQEFDLDYEDRLMNVEGRVYQALCLRDLGRNDEAIEMFDTAMTVREAYGRDGNGPWKLPPEAADYLSVVVRQKALLLNQLGQHDKAIEAAQDFLATTPDALSSAQGKGVMLSLAEAQAQADPKAARDTLDRLSEIDPRGYWGHRARLLIGEMLTGGGSGGGDLSPERLLAVAETLAGGGDAEKAIPVCITALERARGSATEAQVGCDAYMLIGAVYAKRSWYHEAAAAFDAAHESFPGAAKAPDALWRALNCYIELNGAEKLPLYKKRVEERLSLLASKYPTHPNAANAQLIEGRQHEAARNYGAAAEFYLKVRPGSPVYFEARYRAASCHFRQSRQLFAQGKADEAKALTTKCEEIYKALRDELAKEGRETLDTQLQSRYQAIDFEARMSLAGLYLQPETNRPNEVLPLLDTIDPKYAADPERSTQIWDYRIRTLQALGKVDDAQNLLEALIASGADETTVGGPAGLIASHLDQRAADLVKTQKTLSPQALDLWRKAARYYGLKLRPQLSGKLPLQPTDANAVANRLFAIGLLVNGVPEGVDSFVGVGNKFEVREVSIWEQAASVYEAVIASIPSAQATVNLGRVLGFLGKWKEAGTVYDKLFAEEQIVDLATNGLNKELLAARPVLLPAYLEWGVVEYKLGAVAPGGDNLRRSIDILNRVGAGTDQGSLMWWRARYWRIRALMDNGNYVDAGVAMRNLLRNFTNFDDGKYGMADLFAQIASELSAKGVSLK